MIPILTSQQIREADQFTIENEPIASINLMERASAAFVDWFVEKFSSDQSVFVVCGTGNNGGDGLAIARMLKERKYYTKARVVGDPEEGSIDFKTNLERWKKISLTENTYSVLQPGSYDVIIDALFGSGLTRPLEGTYIDLVNQINESKATIVSVDIASGLFASEPSIGVSVLPDFTVTFQVPKLNFFLSENEKSVGDWCLVDIGLNKVFLARQETPYYLLTPDYIKSILKKRSKFGHKGSYGKGVIFAGSYGKMGACVLAAKAALRSGIGLLTAHIPSCGYSILQTALPEAMASVDDGEHIITGIPDLTNYNGIGIGPGIGTENETVYCLTEVLQKLNIPIVLDADALNILANHHHLLDMLPESTILTPHSKEFERLVGSWSNDPDRLRKQRNFSEKYKVIVVLKGAHTSISDSQGNVYFNNTGNPGMATAGSGDVLTGIITSSLSQGYEPLEAALMSVFVHGMAGDIAAISKGTIGLIASDIVESIPNVFIDLNRTKRN